MRDRPLLLVALLIAAATFVILRPAPDAEDETTAPETPVRSASLMTDEYGMPVSELSVEESTVRRNETFSDLLTPYGVAYDRIVTLARSNRDVFDVRRLKSGQPYRVYSDSAGVGRFMVYERDLTSYVVFDLGPEPSVRVEERVVEVRTRTVEGSISQSLYMTLVDQGIDPHLANEMANVFAWQIDFSRLQVGDTFRILFEERYVGDKYIGVGNVLAARFGHRSEDYTAFHFANGDVDEHYDQNGNSLRKAFLIAPVEYKRISSGFSANRFHPVQKRYKAHLGTDYAADTGTPIMATGDGVVTEARYGQYNGNYVKIRHNGTYTTQYLHMSRIKSGIRPGVAIRQGDIIGFVGSTGLATGPHVCYRFWKNGEQVDHRKEKIPSSGPIPPQYLAEFNGQRDQYMLSLAQPLRPGVDMSYARLLDTPEAITSP
ncbi:MAG: peptidoglycan DD-metalloendopeptidase family protein [Bacteroidetes bacterium]|nr:peptidoglycan DD-metalloendopeptidase family protein [Bacteroidota bacterium]MDA0873752.1 peptidoglycan DD-metalloendopeptidase family protein [Bacteroidota bacterium]